MSTPRTLPAPGAAWFPMAMGTGILATLLQLATGSIRAAHPAAVGLLVVAWVVLVGLILTFAEHSWRDRSALAASVREPIHVPMWGTVSMGILAVGSATLTVVPATWPALANAAWHADAVMWTVGTVIGLLAAFGFTMQLLRSDCGAPSTIWGLAVVGPMVSATTGAALVPHAGQVGGIWLLVATVGCFFTSLVLGTAVFAVAYHHHWRTAPVPLAASCSTWIPLGMVGQSTAAVQAIADRSVPLVIPAVIPTIHAIANCYGVAVLMIGIPLSWWAAVVTVRGFRQGMPFTPGWWALTFPIGTLALGTTLLGRSLGLSALAAMGLVLTAVLCATVTLCSVATARALLTIPSRVRRAAVSSQRG